MEGLIVLNKIPIYTTTDIQVIIFAIFTITFLIMSFGYFMKIIRCEKILCFLLTGMIISFFALIYQPKIKQYQYDVLLNGINIQELYNQYNIISVKGAIYTIEPKGELNDRN